MRISDENILCSFCGLKPARSGIYGKESQIIGCCRNCANDYLAEMFAEANFHSIQQFDSLQDQNKSMPELYDRKLEFFKTNFYRTLMDLCHNDVVYELEDGHLVDRLNTKKFKAKSQD